MSEPERRGSSAWLAAFAERQPAAGRHHRTLHLRETGVDASRRR
jgi:hypothetical protein